MTAIQDVWWLPIVGFLLLASLIWFAKKKIGRNPDKRQQETIMTLGILLMVAGTLYPSASRDTEQLLTIPRIILIADVVFIVAASTRIIFRTEGQARPPNKAL